MLPVRTHGVTDGACASMLCESTYSVNSVLSNVDGVMCRQCGGLSHHNSCM